MPENPPEGRRRKKSERLVQGSDVDLRNRFLYHKPDGEHVTRHEMTRDGFLHFALEMASLVPEGRERSLMLTKLEEASFWAHAGIARNEL